MKILVVGGTGLVGSEVARRLVIREQDVWVLSHSSEAVRSWPVGAASVYGDLLDPDSLDATFEDVECAFLLFPVGPEETVMGLNAVQAARKHGVQRLVYMSVAHIDDGVHIPHFRSKIPIENAVRESGITHTILRPNNFYQNDFYFRESILSGVYPQPIGDVGVHRVDIRDIADAAVNALLRDGFEGQTYPINGPRALTGDDVAKTYSRYLRRDVRYIGNDLEVWSRLASQMLPDWMVHDFRIMYDHFQVHGMLATEDELERQKRVIGHDPLEFDLFVSEVTTEWLRERAAA
ncbi:MAG: NmrA family NAD(P)-binding protein [Armatimonadota bacterium]|nr:NmrA family NAD(P)-binding protein [Armatimonadota bacterium]